MLDRFAEIWFVMDFNMELKGPDQVWTDFRDFWGPKMAKLEDFLETVVMTSCSTSLCTMVEAPGHRIDVSAQLSCNLCRTEPTAKGQMQAPLHMAK